MAQIEAHAAAAARHAWHSFAPGRRVYDSESGLDGTVLASQVSYIVAAPAGDIQRVPAASLFTLQSSFVTETVEVRLDDDTAVTRDAAELVGLPGTLTHLPADLAGPQNP